MQPVRVGVLGVALCGLVACGDNAAPIEDLPPPPGSNDPQPGPVTVTFNDGGSPLEGMMVIFHNPDGTVIDDVTTDANGQATATIPPNAMISLLMVPQPVLPIGGGQYSNLYTLMGIQPNDTYTFDVNPQGGAQHPSYQNIDVNLPGSFEGATYYYVYNGCTNTGSSDSAAEFIMYMSHDCLNGSGKFAVLAIAQDGNGQMIAYSFLDNQTPVEQPIITFGGGGNPVVNLPAWETTFTDANIDFEDYWQNGYSYVYGNLLHNNGWYLNWYLPETGVVRQPNGVGTVFELSSYTSFEDAAAWSLDGLEMPLSDMTISLETLSPGRIIGAYLSNSTDSRPTVSFASTASPSALDGTLVCLEYDNYPPPVFGIPPSQQVIWHILAPPGAEEVQLPELPEEFAYLAPGETTYHNEIIVTQFAASDVDGYEQLRADARFDIASPDFDIPVAGFAMDVLQYWYDPNSGGPAVDHRKPPRSLRPGTPRNLFGGIQTYCSSMD